MQTIRTQMRERAESLEACALFAGVGDDALERLARRAAVRGYESGEIVYHHDEPAEGFFIVLEGTIRVYRVGADGREQVLHVFGPGEPVGEVPVFEHGAYPASASAQTPCRVLWLSRDAFLDAGRDQPELLLQMLAVLSRRLRRFVGLIDDLSLKEVSARLAKHLLDLSVHQDSERVELETTKAMLAARLGTIAETLSRTLARMKRRGMIETHGRAIQILDRDALIELAAGEKL